MTAARRSRPDTTAPAKATAEPRDRLISLSPDDVVEADTPAPPTTHPPPPPSSTMRPAPPRLPTTHSPPPPQSTMRARASASPRPPLRARVRGDELVDVVFERVQAMSLLGDALHAARYCLVVLGDALPCRASVVHFFDASCREFIVAVARGEQPEDMLLKRHKMSDPLLRAARAHGRPFSWNDLSDAPLRSIGRYAALASVSRVLVCPVIVGAQWLGAIELVDPLDGDPFDSGAETAVAHVAGHLEDFLTSHSVIVEVAAIARFAHADA